jgi:hypothetical protein
VFRSVTQNARVQSSAYGSGFRVSCLGFRLQGLSSYLTVLSRTPRRMHVPNQGIRVEGFGPYLAV